MRKQPGLLRLVPFVLVFAFAACSGETQSPTAPAFEKSLAPAAATAADESPAEVRADQPAARRGRLAERLAAGPTGAEVQPEGAVAVVAAGRGGGNGGSGNGGNGNGGNGNGNGDNGNGNGNGGNGNGNGNGGNGGGNGNAGQGELRVELQPDTWNTNWEHSRGTVSALIKGEDFGDIDPSSIVLIGTDGAEAPLPAERVQSGGNHLRAFFGMADALDTLDTPTRGETHVVTIRFTADGQTVELTDRVRIVGPAGGQGDDEEEDVEEVSLAIQPDTWNTNWARSAGTVSAMLRGSAHDSIVAASIFLVGTDPAAAPLAPLRVQRADNHVRAFFGKAAALATLDTPTPGETHEVEIHFTDASGAVVLVDRVRIVGPGN